MRPPKPSPKLLLSIDCEDWSQIVARHVGLADWDRRYVSFERQMRSVFALLEGRRATFFLLGMTLKNYPEVAQEVVRQGHEVACHGFDHELVGGLDREAFRRDVERSIELIEALTGQRPRGYRAPQFSVTRDTVWAFETLAALGFAYDSSLHDTPKDRARVEGIPTEPFTMNLPSGRSLLEFPLTVWRRGSLRVPVGGGSYWRVLPTAVLDALLRDGGINTPLAALYFHPYECDAGRLRVELPPGATLSQRARAAYWRFRYRPGQDRIVRRLGAMIRHFEVMSYDQACDHVRDGDGPRSRTLSPRGVLV
jgi:polysaccharide deacetylase family protein (PEP-CTERM system associated)